MNTIVEESMRSLNRRNLKKDNKSFKVLFVAPSSSGQLQVAKYFWNFFRPEHYSAEFAALENATINPWLYKSMEDFGVSIEQKQISSIFLLSTNCKEFDSIITFGKLQLLGTISPFMQTLEILFGAKPNRLCWDIPDPEEMKGNRKDLLQHADNIRDRIEFEIAQFAQSLEEKG